MRISKKDWNKYINKLAAINEKASSLIVSYVNKNGLDDVEALVNFALGVAKKYGNASAAMSALMYDTISELEGMLLPAAELAELPTYGDVAKSVYGTLKTSQNAEEIGGAVSRLVKRTGQDTMLHNAVRDHAEYAWIPMGDTCAFCLTLASQGWQPMSRDALEGGHAEHIHSNCKCSYMIRHSSDFDVSGYHPEEYREMYYEADEDGPSKDKINALRREQYAENKDEINEQKRAAYEKRQEVEEDETEE